MLLHNGIKFPALEEGSHPIPQGWRELRARWAAHGSSRNGEWEAAAQTQRQICLPLLLTQRLVLTSFTAEELKCFESVLYSNLWIKSPWWLKWIPVAGMSDVRGDYLDQTLRAVTESVTDLCPQDVWNNELRFREEPELSSLIQILSSLSPTSSYFPRSFLLPT